MAEGSGGQRQSSQRGWGNAARNATGATFSGEVDSCVYRNCPGSAWLGRKRRREGERERKRDGEREGGERERKERKADGKKEGEKEGKKK